MAPRAATGPAHVAVVSFLAARAAPTGGFWIALAGGVALARVAERRGARLGFGASAAAMLETVAIIGPARLGVPLTQAVSAPMLGRLHARGVGFWPQLLACAHGTPAPQRGHHRLLHLGDHGRPRRLRRHLRRDRPPGRHRGGHRGRAGAHAARPARLGGLREHGAGAGLQARAAGVGGGRRDSTPPAAGWRQTSRFPQRSARHLARFDPRAVAAAALVAFVLLLSSTAWVLLAAVAAWLALVWVLSRAESDPVPAGLVFAAVLAGGALRSSPSAAGSASTSRSGALRGPRCSCSWPPGCARRRGRAGCARCRGASWVACAGSRRRPRPPRCLTRSPPRAGWRPPGARSRRGFRRLRSGPAPLLDAVLAWVIREAAVYEPPAPAAPLRLRARALDLALLVSAAPAPALA